MKLDILAIAIHPDDIELGCGATIAKHTSLGYQVGILDLSSGELGTRGTPEIRLAEAKAAAKILGVAIREQLQFADCFFENNKAHQLEIIKILRKYKPDLVLANATVDRHPDHGRAAKLTADACFYSGLQMIETQVDGVVQEAWRPKNVFHYIQSYNTKPDFVVDVTGFDTIKMEAIQAYKSQFYDPTSDAPATFISTPEFLEMVKSRMIDFGQQIGKTHAEGFTSSRHIAVFEFKDLI